jgi:hypothetical protein
VRDAATNRSGDATNVRIIPDIEELKALINTLVSEVDEAFVETIQEKAKALFFEPKSEGTIYYKEHLGQKLREEFKTQLSEKPVSATHRSNGTWFVAGPRFVGKHGQRVTWATRVTVEAKALKHVPGTSLTINAAPPTGLWATTTPTPTNLYITSEQPQLLTGLFDLGAHKSAMTEELVATGKTVFEVTWSVAVSTARKLSSPRVEELTFVETTWSS